MLIQGSGIKKSFRVGRGTIEVLRGIDLAIPAGEFCAIMGRSGSGKSTLLHCLAGLEELTSGTIEVEGVALATLSREKKAIMRRRRLGFVFQQYNLIPTLTVFENVALPWRLEGRRVDRKRIQESLRTLGVDAIANKRPDTLSGGEQQRAALARVLAQDPTIIFADEPTGALDTRSAGMALDQLAEMAHHRERCVVMVTHDAVAAAKCDRVLFISDGKFVGSLIRPQVAAVTSMLSSLEMESA